MYAENESCNEGNGRAYEDDGRYGKGKDDGRRRDDAEVVSASWRQSMFI